MEDTIKKELLQYNGSTFSSHEEATLWLEESMKRVASQARTDVIKEAIEKIQKI